MTILFAFMFLVVALAIVMLFAMNAEILRRLESRPHSDEAERSDAFWSLTRPEIYIRDDIPWHAELDTLRGGGGFLILVFSTVCTTCNTAAAELGTFWKDQNSCRIGVVISTPNSNEADSFMSRHSISTIPHFVDADGEWVKSKFGVTFSPVAMIIEDDTLRAVYGFQHVPPLWETISKEMSWEEKTTVEAQPVARVKFDVEASSAASGRAV